MKVVQEGGSDKIVSSANYFLLFYFDLGYNNNNFSGNGRRPKFFRKWKTNSIFQEMEVDLNFSGNGNDLNFSGNGRRPPVFRKYKTT